jgi:hypothetical protein
MKRNQHPETLRLARMLFDVQTTIPFIPPATEPTDMSTRPAPNGRKFKIMQRTKSRKPQDDRLLKRLPRKERRQQENLRRMILGDPIFKTI